MPDREKVIKEKLDEMVELTRGLSYAGFMTAVENANEILSLLKEQEAVEPITQSSVYDPDTWFFVCGSCKKGVIERGDKFCRWCGQAVKWK